MSDSDGSAIGRLLEEVRRDLDRVQPEELAAEVAAGAMVVDIRPWEQRSADGKLPGAVVIDRNVLEWRLDPTSPYRLEDAADPQRRVILVCNEGYSSSLAAYTLKRLGLHNATDLVGGFQAWALWRVKGRLDLPGGGREMCPVTATRTARWWPWDLPRVWPPPATACSAQGAHPLAGQGLGEPDRVTGGLADMGVMEQPVDCGGGQCLGHQLVERTWKWHTF